MLVEILKAVIVLGIPFMGMLEIRRCYTKELAKAWAENDVMYGKFIDMRIQRNEAISKLERNRIVNAVIIDHVEYIKEGA